MAPTQTQLQQALALRKQNPNLSVRDAVSQVAKPIDNTPIAWQAPATPATPVAPTAPVSVHDNPNYQSNTTEQYNRNVLAQNQAKAAAKADTSQANPPVIIQQAEAATAQANAPVKTETPTAPVTPTEAKTETPTTPVTPATPTETKKEAQAPVITPDSNNIYANLRTNTPIPDSVKSTPQYRDAQNRYNNFQKYASYDVNTLTAALWNWTILPWTSTWNDLMTDPVMWAKILQAKAFSNWKASDFAITTQNASDNIVANSPTVAWMFADGQITAEEWANATNTPEVKAKMADVEAKKNAYDALKAKYDDVETQVNAEFPWSPFADSIIADRRKSMFKELTILWDTYNNALGTLTQLKSDAGNLFEMNMKLYQERKAEENQYKMAKYQAQLWLATNQAKLQQEADFARQEAIKNINDPATAINNVMNEYKKLGIPFTTTLQSRLQEFANSGKSLPDYLTQMTESIQASPAYKDYQAKKEWEWTSYVQFWDKVYKNVNWVLTETSISTIKAKEEKTPSWKQDMNWNWYNENSNVSPEEQIWTWKVDIWTWTLLDSLGKNVWTYTWNRWYDLAWNIWDPLPAWWNWKVISTDTAGEQKWSVFISWKWAKPYWNTVVMEDENGNRIRYSHLDSINVKKDDVLWFGSIVWTRGNTWHVLWKNWETLTPEQLAQWRGAHVDIEIKDKSWRLLSNEEQKNYLAGIKKPQPSQNLSIYRAYVEDQKVPSKDVLKWLWMTSQQFINNADAWYTQFLDSKAKEISDTYQTLDISYTPTYSQNSPTQREKLNESITKIWEVDSRLNQLLDLFEKSWTEVLPTKTKSEMESLRKQIILKAKDVENLWVLNWPDLWILEDMLPSTTWIMSWLFSFDSNTKAKLENIRNNYRNDAKTKWINYWAKIIFTDAIEKELADSF